MGSDVLILTIYFLVVIYVLYQMALSLESQLEEKVKIDLDLDAAKTSLGAQIEQLPLDIPVRVVDGMALAAKLLKMGGPSFFNGDPKKMPSIRRLELSIPEGEGLSGKLTLNAGPTGKLSKDLLKLKGKFLTLELTNRTLDTQTLVDWDRSSITYLSTEAKRAIRVAPNMSWDAQQRQVFSVINPGESLRANVTTEKSFARNPDTRQLEPKNALLNVDELVTFASPKLKDMQGAMGRGMFSLNVMLGLRRLAQPETLTMYLLVPFNFNVELLEDEIAFPPLRWLLERPERRPGTFLNTMVLGRRPRR